MSCAWGIIIVDLCTREDLQYSMQLFSVFLVLANSISWFGPFSQAGYTYPLCNSSHPNFVSIELTLF